MLSVFLLMTKLPNRNETALRVKLAKCTERAFHLETFVDNHLSERSQSESG